MIGCQLLPEIIINENKKLEINPEKELEDLNQDMKCMNLHRGRVIFINLIKEDPPGTSKESFDELVDPPNKITNSLTSKDDNTNVANIFKIEKKAEIERLEGRRIRKLTRRRSKSKKQDVQKTFKIRKPR